MRPTSVVVVVEAVVSDEWRFRACHWLARAGCRYLMAWGLDCSTWDDSMDWVAIELEDAGVLTGSSDSVLTTWHADQPLSEVFDYCKNTHARFLVEDSTTLLLHVASHRDEGRILKAYRDV